jgi:hypothetical protein
VMMDVIQMHEDMEEEEESEARGEEINPEREKEREMERAEAEARSSIACQASWKSTSTMHEMKKAVEARPEWSMLDSRTQ